MCPQLSKIRRKRRSQFWCVPFPLAFIPLFCLVQCAIKPSQFGILVTYLPGSWERLASMAANSRSKESRRILSCASWANVRTKRAPAPLASRGEPSARDAHACMHIHVLRTYREDCGRRPSLLVAPPKDPDLACILDRFIDSSSHSNQCRAQKTPPRSAGSDRVSIGPPPSLPPLPPSSFFFTWAGPRRHHPSRHSMPPRRHAASLVARSPAS